MPQLGIDASYVKETGRSPWIPTDNENYPRAFSRIFERKLQASDQLAPLNLNLLTSPTFSDLIFKTADFILRKRILVKNGQIKKLYQSKF